MWGFEDEVGNFIKKIRECFCELDWFYNWSPKYGVGYNHQLEVGAKHLLNNLFKVTQKLCPPAVCWKVGNSLNFPLQLL